MFCLERVSLKCIIKNIYLLQYHPLTFKIFTSEALVQDRPLTVKRWTSCDWLLQMLISITLLLKFHAQLPNFGNYFVCICVTSKIKLKLFSACMNAALLLW